MSDESQSAPTTLNYNLRWAERTFSNPSTTEALLAPQRDAGNVSYNDYQATVQFSAGYHPFYRLIGGLLGVPLTIALRRPSWSPLRAYAFLSLSTFGGTCAGQVMNFSAHFGFVRSLENPSGFGQALQNIQNNSGSPVPPGLTIVRKGSRWALLGSDASPIASPTLPPTPDVQNPSTTPPSKWDQIRAVNARPSTNSSWDALRQNHERTRVSSSNSDTDLDASQRSRDEDRAVEQARFNEMLERERNIKDDS